ncbi:MAG TPA: hypothetical protein PLY93_03765, partial [Turneriella sp.]|nr:hypothetical protein [Turneriella sp.]
MYSFGRAYFKITALLFVVFIMPLAVYGIGTTLEMPGKTAEQATEKSKNVLKKLNTNCIEQDITLGSQWRCKTPFFSIVGLDIFVSTLPDRAIVRADAINRQSYAFIDALAQENGEGPFTNKYEEKSLLMTIGTTLLSPALGYWYTNSNSMVRSKSMLLPVLGLFLGDVALFWM